MKTIDEFVELFGELFDDIDTSNFTPETNFRDNDEWSSLIALSVIAMVDDEFDVTLVGNDIKNATTIADIYNCIVAKSE
ncbi:acyl carrier protein [Bacteroides sp. OF04-15BH]|uniref:acyl carrier protein n=1 Tax=Bacteroides sp. OF04-15BH TaxID=2292281 RepID=UPI000E4E676C|nr:acyl carrier protein [Bacteroides sp. OF04-15BH]RHP66413.1 acyl carrier protein [Bacteroides sp. OF04-15BH]